MRRSLFSAVAGAVLIALMLPVASTGASASGNRHDWPAWERIQSFHAQLRAEALARIAARGGQALPAPNSFDPRQTDAFTTVKNAEQISRQNVKCPPDQPSCEPDTQIEPDIAMDPNNDQDIVAVFQQGRFPDGGSVDPGYSTSLDGGKTWTDGHLPHLTIPVGGKLWTRASDPAVAFGPGGVAYAVTLTINFGTGSSGVAVQRSRDGGIHWSDPLYVHKSIGEGVPDDKEWIAVDTFKNSPHYGRVYVTWDRVQNNGVPVVVAYSDDQGNTWSNLIQVSTTSGIGAIPVVQPNGNVTIIYDNGPYVAQTSTDGGKTWGSAVTINTDQGSDSPGMRSGAGLESAGVDPTNGKLYAAWQDRRFRTDGRNDIVVARSSDGGKTWSQLVKANPDKDGSGLDHVTPAVAANNGFVHVSYFARECPNGTCGNILTRRYVHSEDGGKTFGNELTLGPKINLTWAAQAGGKFLGDYTGMAASATSAHDVWCRSSKPPKEGKTYHQTAWSATIVK